MLLANSYLCAFFYQSINSKTVLFTVVWGQVVRVKGVIAN